MAGVVTNTSFDRLTSRQCIWIQTPFKYRTEMPILDDSRGCLRSLKKKLNKASHMREGLLQLTMIK